jgi:hypothetical protein
MNRQEKERKLILLREKKKREEFSLALKDDKLFCSKYIKIVNKQGNAVDFNFNPIQTQIDDKIEELTSEGKPARIIVLKARQEGVSTYTQAKILKRTATIKNRNALVVAHRDDSTSAIFEKAKYMYNNLPEDIKPLQKASNAKELIFDIPSFYKGDKEGLNSKIKIQTAGSDSIGRSDTYYYVHLSEFAFYTGNPQTQLTGILQAVPNIPGTIVIIESTANGYNDFKELWESAENGDNDFVPMFFAWHDYVDYQLSCTNEEAIEIMSTLNEYESNIVKLYNLKAEQIKWYRWKLKNDCNGNVELMKQENPSYPKEAFLSTGRPVFNNETVEIKIEQLKKQCPLKQGHFYFEWNNPDVQDFIKADTIKWVDDKTGPIKIYEDTKDKYPYVLGGDTKGEGKDFYTGTIINNATGVRCATVRMQISNSKPYTHQMYCLGMYYNTALIGIEINFNTAPIEELQRLKYPRQYQRQQYDNFTKDYQKKYGWKTDGNTRPLIIDKEIDLIENNIDLFNDIVMLTECTTFIYDENGRPDAQSGKHDDQLFSDMIASEIRGQQSFMVVIEQPVPRLKLIDQLGLNKHTEVSRW